MSTIRSLALRAGTPLLFLAGVPLAAQQQTTYPNFKIAARINQQAYFFGNEDYAAVTGPESNFFIRRARIQVNAQVTENISFIIQPDFAGGRTISNNRAGVRLRDVYIDVRLTPAAARTAFTVRMGQEKRPFSRWELTSSNNLVVIERGAGPGLLPLGSNNLFGAAGFLAHDVGAAGIVTHRLAEGRALTVQAGVYNGQGESVNDVNNKKSFGVRGTVEVTPRLSLGAAFFSHDQIQGADSGFTNQAFGLEAQWNRPGDAGLHLLAEYLDGENNNATQDPMRGISVIGAYHIRTGRPGLIWAVEPIARVDLADPDTGVDDNGSTLITAGIGLYFSSKAQFRVVFERQSFQAPGAEAISGVRSAMTVNF